MNYLCRSGGLSLFLIFLAFCTGCKDSGGSNDDNSEIQNPLMSKFDENTPTADGFEPEYFLAPFEPIVDIPLGTVAEADEKLEDNELILGVVVNGEARGYPIIQLMGPTREIVNDSVGGVDLAATW